MNSILFNFSTVFLCSSFSFLNNAICWSINLWKSFAAAFNSKDWFSKRVVSIMWWLVVSYNLIFGLNQLVWIQIVGFSILFVQSVRYSVVCFFTVICLDASIFIEQSFKKDNCLDEFISIHIRLLLSVYTYKTKLSYVLHNNFLSEWWLCWKLSLILGMVSDICTNKNISLKCTMIKNHNEDWPFYIRVHIVYWVWESLSTDNHLYATRLIV